MVETKKKIPESPSDEVLDLNQMAEENTSLKEQVQKYQLAQLVNSQAQFNLYLLEEVAKIKQGINVLIDAFNGLSEEEK